MKKILSILVVLLVLVGCGASKDTGDTGQLEKIVLGGTSLPHADFLRQLSLNRRKSSLILKRLKRS